MAETPKNDETPKTQGEKDAAANADLNLDAIMSSANDDTSGEAEKRPSLFVATEGAAGRDGGPYLDREQRREQEILNARREGRAPNFENPAFAPSTVLITEGELAANSTEAIKVEPAVKRVAEKSKK